ncbi:hypothetical protein K470DRAFT_219024 [Piedraia hortae CBS 480.64]|uniref:Dilute domain-containing protein n=1 Tax=Piedraia hortae CBS 480.64 TaxID=1314780 RepID=A0A6A7BVX3_9PEZI|nr:hypothetical protein K470DRAFT_219024 [Piedraia hortae CBS 480.64]
MDERPRLEPRQLPADLPRSLDDRIGYSSYQPETEYYDGWQGHSQFITAPKTATQLNFNLSLHEPDTTYDGFGPEDAPPTRKGSEADADEAQEEALVDDTQMSRDQKAKALQDLLFMAVCNGDVARVRRLVRGRASPLIDVDGVDAEGTPPLVYASCFGRRDAVLALLDAGAAVDGQDRNQWTALMWAMTNSHKEIAKTLLDHGASTDIKSSSGRTALDFAPPGGEMTDFLQRGGYSIGNAGVTEDFYSSGFSQDRFEEELAESEMRRRMMMESAINLEVDLGNLGLDEQPESPDEDVCGQDFVWDRCLNDQMFVFIESDIDRILDIVVTNMAPQRSPSQKPVPANVIFLGARYAHYHSTKELLGDWLTAAHERIEAVVERHQGDMTVLAFWLSNATLLSYYLGKDPGVNRETTRFRGQLEELVLHIYLSIIGDAERRMDKVLAAAMLEHETIPGFEDIAFQNEWKFLRSKPKVKPEPAEKRFRPLSPRRKAQVSPRNITSLLSSTLFVLDLYDVHSVMIAQALSQLYYWLGAELFNRIMSNKRYLARTKAMQIRMNVSMLEDWARANNRKPNHYDSGSFTPGGEPTVESARRHLAPVVQLLQWLQCFSSLGDDKDAIEGTLQQLPALSTTQLLQAVKHYRAEVGEKTLNKTALKRIQEIKSRPQPPSDTVAGDSRPQTPRQLNHPSTMASSPRPDDDDVSRGSLLNASLLLPFQLPNSTDMLVSYGAGLGGVNRERERQYSPSVPHDFLIKLDPDNSRQGIKSIYENARLSDVSS